MTATILTIGDEILIGQVVDTNSAFIAQSLDKIGIDIHEFLSISDDRQHILGALAQLQDQVDLVVITGGLGPTKDDITKHTFCDYFNDILVRNEEVENHIVNLFEKILNIPATQVNKDQALVPSQCIVLKNENGTAPGMWMKKGNTVFIALPGVPYEMKAIVTNVIIPKVVTEYKRPYIIHKTILTYGMGESMLADKIADWENNLPTFIKLAYLPNAGKVRLRLSGRGTDKAILEKAIEENVTSLTKIIGEIIVGFDDNETLEVVVGRLLSRKNKTLATAESCTGGKIAQVLTAIPGASKYFKGSIVAYDKAVKTEVLGISEETIKKHSVVSAQVAEEMATNIRRLLKTDFGIGVTGNAGPTSDDTNEAIGIIFIALATADGVASQRFSFGQPREKVIDRTVNKSLEMLQAAILKNALDKI